MTNLPLVRLSRDGQWAVCARVECGTRFARRRVHLAERQVVRVAGSDEPLEVPLGEDETILRFLPGWVNKETHRLEDGWMAPGGVWTMSQRARERIEKGDRPFRRPSPRRSLGKTAYGYPALVICPACHQAQVADEGVLGLR